MKTNNISRCLVVDDNRDLLSITRTMLAHVTDAEVCCCDSAAEAIAKFSAEPRAFDFVITDLDMPKMNGIELCRQLREIEPGLKIILATGSEYVSDEEAGRNGFFRMLHKPFPLATLRATVNALRECAAPAMAA